MTGFSYWVGFAGLVACLVFTGRAPLGMAASTITFTPRCLADVCPQCPQRKNVPLDIGDCPQCLDRNLNHILKCSRSDHNKNELRQDIIGLWKSPSGLSMLIVENTRGLFGYTYNVPEKLVARYPRRMAVMAEFTPNQDATYKCRILAPSGKWVESVFTPQGEEMDSVFPASKANVRWRRTIRLKAQQTGAGTVPPQP